ncbi:MAG: sulfotransferase [Deltaproteobacteria bacterium]|nr:sulfotransferase [Deltaproteobacteria bacterium]MBW2398846.1 sulfotransferase [Deltaproteobacteria bacterium]
MEKKLLFLIGPPRSGSTLLTRMLGGHPEVFAPQEPHLLTPLAHLGYYASVEKAPYDAAITQAAMRELVGALPGGENDYLDALRACSDTLYQRLLAPSGQTRLLDKTPAYALVLDFVAKLYPSAPAIVLTRNPIAVWSSFGNSFFDGDHSAAHAHNPLLERYVPAIARFLRERPMPCCHVRYEELVADPDTQLRRICDFADLEFDPEMIEYGGRPEGQERAVDGLGDPITVAKETRPTTKSIEKWTSDLAGNPDSVALARRILDSLLDEDLATWGYSRQELSLQLDSVDIDGARPKRAALTRYTAQRKLLVLLRRNIHHNAFGRLIRKFRTACDVLLR